MTIAKRFELPLTVQTSRGDWLAVALLAAVVSGWAALSSGVFSVAVLVACAAGFFAFYLTGSLFFSIPGVSGQMTVGLPLRILLGYALVNSALLALAWLSPFGLATSFGFLLSVVVLLFLSARKSMSQPSHPASYWVVALCVAATSLWCQDSLDPIIQQDGVVTFKPWVDGFYHAVHIRIFAESQGAGTIEDFRMAGVPARLYHYGVYMFPAFIKAVSGAHSYGIFAGILAPLGVLFTGFAAYSLVSNFWGPWPGCTAAGALMLLPDGSQQGMQNKFMSYQWLTQISPSATFGLAILALSWLFVILGSSRSSRTQLGIGWGLSAVLLAYKFHYVVASSLLLLLVPAMFFGGRIGFKRRVLGALLAFGLYGVALFFGQRAPGVPRIVFDGSGSSELLFLTQTFVRPGPLRDYLAENMGRGIPWLANLAYGAPYVLLAILGLILPLLLVMVVLLHRRTSSLVLWFPLLIIGNFLLMFFGLSLDMSSSTPEELSHRPLMIVYFFSVTWVGGAVGFWLLESKRLAKYATVGLLSLGAALLILVPYRMGPGIQLMWVMRSVSPVRVPAELIEVAGYIRENSKPGAIIQDAQFDRIYALSALSERQSFVSHTLTRMPFRADMVATRSRAVDHIMSMTLPKLASATAEAYGWRYFVVARGNPLRWPASFKDNPTFEAGRYRVYEF